MTLGEIHYESDFYKDGKRYKQLIRVKHPRGVHSVVCCTGPQYEVIVDVLSTENIKPVVRI